MQRTSTRIRVEGRMFFHGVEEDFKTTETVCTMLDESSLRARGEADVANYRVQDG